MHLSDSAVEKHVLSILAKMGLSDECEVNRRFAAGLKFLEISKS